jgi:hypothetical protein
MLSLMTDTAGELRAEPHENSCRLRELVERMSDVATQLTQLATALRQRDQRPRRFAVPRRRWIGVVPAEFFDCHRSRLGGVPTMIGGVAAALRGALRDGSSHLDALSHQGHERTLGRPPAANGDSGTNTGHFADLGDRGPSSVGL